MSRTLLSVLPNPEDLLALGAEDLGGVVLELAPGVIQNGAFSIDDLLASVFPRIGPSYPQGTHRPVMLALAEALSCLTNQGLIVRDPTQLANWYVITRQGKALRTRADVDAFRKGRVLPVELLQPTLAEKVRPLFLRGDHDVALFQALKVVEVAVRNAANAKGANYPDDLVGVKLMRKAFHPEGGPLTDASLVIAEREGDMALFAGAIACAKNPPGHRDFDVSPQEAARLIVFASHLLSIVEQRSPPAFKGG